MRVHLFWASRSRRFLLNVSCCFFFPFFFLLFALLQSWLSSVKTRRLSRRAQFINGHYKTVIPFRDMAKNKRARSRTTTTTTTWKGELENNRNAQAEERTTIRGVDRWREVTRTLHALPIQPPETATVMAPSSQFVAGQHQALIRSITKI